MPSVSKQNPTRQPQSSNGTGILASAIDVGSIVNDYMKMVLYGMNRSGKTTLACQFEKPLLLVSFEPGQAGGASSVKKIQGVSYVRITSKAQAIELARELRTDRKYKTHALDTCTSLQDVILKELMGLEEVPVQLNWGSVSQDYYRERSEQAKEIMRLYRDLPAHTIFICQEKDHNPPKDDKGRTENKLTRSLQLESYFAADLGAGTVKWMHDACDYIGHLHIAKETKVVVHKAKFQGKDVSREEVVETGRQVRRLRTLYHCNYAAGFRSPNPEVVPEYIEAASPQDMYKAIMDVVNGKRTDKGHYPAP